MIIEHHNTSRRASSSSGKSAFLSNRLTFKTRFIIMLIEFGEVAQEREVSCDAERNGKNSVAAGSCNSCVSLA